MHERNEIIVVFFLWLVFAYQPMRCTEMVLDRPAISGNTTSGRVVLEQVETCFCICLKFVIIQSVSALDDRYMTKNIVHKFHRHLSPFLSLCVVLYYRSCLVLLHFFPRHKKQQVFLTRN